MPTVLPTPIDREPQYLFAGDYVSWTRSSTGHGDDGTISFPATNWTLQYFLRGPKVYNFTATTATDGVSFLIILTSAITEAWAVGYYAVSAFFTATDGSGDRFPLKPYFSVLEVRPNPAKAAQGIPDARPWALQMVGVVEQAIADLVSRKAAQVSVNGQSYSIQDVEKLYRMRAKFQAEADRLNQQERLNAGLGGKKNILVRFRKPAAEAFPQYPWPP